MILGEKAKRNRLKKPAGIPYNSFDHLKTKKASNNEKAIVTSCPFLTLTIKS
jgi:hypothetical protein